MGQSLRNGLTVSCGCYHRDKLKQTRRDLSEQRFGRLTVICQHGRAGKFVAYLCQCDCGKMVSVRGTSLVNGHTTSCGCFRLEQASKACTTHGQSHTQAYIAMKARERLERKLYLDGNWTLAMEKSLRAFQPACVLCGITTRLAVDHVRPLSLGYGLEPGNAVILCIACNSSKLNRTLSDLSVAKRKALLKAADAFYCHWQSCQVLVEV